jgi:hypothetical protein
VLWSSFDGLFDIRKWRSDGIISDEVWFDIAHRLQIN